MKKTIFFFFLGALAAIMLFLFQQYRKLLEIEISFKEFFFTKITKDKITAFIFLDIANASQIDINILRYSINVYFNDIFVCKIEEANKIFIKGNSSETLKAIISFIPADVLKAPDILPLVNAILFYPQNVKIDFRGKMDILIGEALEIKDIDIKKGTTLEDIKKN